MSLCTICNDSAKNTGKPINAQPAGVPYLLLLWPMKDSSGNENKIDCSVAFDAAALTAYLNDSDATKRMYPIGPLEDVSVPVAESQKQEFSSGNAIIISKGLRSFTGIYPKAVAAYSARLDEVGACGDMGVLIVDECNNLRGNTSEKGFVKPKRMTPGTWEAILNWASQVDTTAQNSTIMFTFAKTETDKVDGYITGSSITADLTSAEGLLDVTIENLAATAATDTVTFDAKTMYGGCEDLDGVVGLIDADIEITINGVPAATPYSSITETGNGGYSIVTNEDFLAADAIVVNISKNGLEDSTASTAAV